MQRVEVEWVDAACVGGWDTLDSARERDLETVTSIGYLVKKDKRRVVVAQGVSGDSVLNYTVIPTSWIKRITDV